MATKTKRAVFGLKGLVWLGALAPTAWMIAGFLLGWLGVNPIEKLTHVTGMTTLIILLVTLAVTPVRRLTGWNPIIQIRRPLGLFAFYYALLHFSIWMVLDLGFRLDWVWEDIKKRPYITVGFTAFLLLIPLALTSTKGWIRRLGKRWTRLHMLVYVSTVLGVIHYYWLVKSDVRIPLLLAAIYAVLMSLRIPGWVRRGARRASKPKEGSPSRRRSATRSPTEVEARGVEVGAGAAASSSAVSSR
jgi:sulfoxide reductase heme-binding subunit YedZ